MYTAARFYKGIEFVRISELPLAQKKLLANTLNREIFITIKMNGETLRDCLQLKDYLSWYEAVYPKVIIPEQKEMMSI